MVLNLLEKLLGVLSKPDIESNKTEPKHGPLETLDEITWFAKQSSQEDRLLVHDPRPIHLSPPQREQIDKRIAEFIGDSTSIYACYYAAIVKVNALPLCFDWTAFMALRWDGQIVWIPYDDEPGEVEITQEERLRNLGLFQGTKLHPDLKFLLPPRPSDANDCPACRGTGKLTFPDDVKHLAEKVICSCGGIGWLPPGENP